MNELRKKERKEEGPKGQDGELLEWTVESMVKSMVKEEEKEEEKKEPVELSEEQVKDVLGKLPAHIQPPDVVCGK